MGLFHADNPRIAAEFPRELVRADVHRVNKACALLQQNFRESSRGCAEVDGCFSADIEAETVERREKFQRASADIRESFLDPDFAILRELMTRFGDRGFMNQDVSGEYFRLGALAGIEHTAMYKYQVEAEFAGLISRRFH
jgi:hypothetical protein